MRLRKILFIFALLLFSNCQSKTYQDKIYNIFYKNSTDDQKVSQAVSSDSEFDELEQKQLKQYVFGTDEIPLFPGLKLVEEDSSSFDAMLGNIIISKYISINDKNKIKDVREFYLTTLPQLGWKIIKNKSDDMIYFIRDEDKLEIKFKTFQNTFFIKYFISSALQ